MTHADTTEQGPVEADASSPHFPAPGHPRSPGLSRWFIEGGRSLVFLSVRWRALQASPGMLLLLVACSVLAWLGVQRFWVVGPAQFVWVELLRGWLPVMIAAWGCYALARYRKNEAGNSPGTAQLFGMVIMQGLLLGTAYSLLWAILIRLGNGGNFPPVMTWTLWVLSVIWGFAAFATILLRSVNRGNRGKALALFVAFLVTVANVTDGLSDRGSVWIASNNEENSGKKKPPKRLELTQELMEEQPTLLRRSLAALQQGQPGKVELYALTFSPYAHEDVFRRESQMVFDVLSSRFETTGRSLQLINHVESVKEWPWATPLNLKRSIQQVANLMNKEEDILFIYLTSHGAHDGSLAARFWPLTVSEMRPEQLREWLDEAGIRYRAISVSACYSGSWVAPLVDDNTLVMTAADSEHTSYGCGSKSELTFFGRAVFDEQLRLHTRSFIEAHSAARPVIEQREKEAGKEDGYSNPQISVGEGIKQQLQRLEQRLEPPLANSG